MDTNDLAQRVRRLVNLARATYGGFELDALLRGKIQSASFCPIGRSMRIGVEHWLFVAVGTKHLRVWTLGKDRLAVAEKISAAWEVPNGGLKQSGSLPGCITLTLPFEVCEFVELFDRGFLPDYQDQVDHQEMRRLRDLARNIPIVLRQDLNSDISAIQLNQN